MSAYAAFLETLERREPFSLEGWEEVPRDHLVPGEVYTVTYEGVSCEMRAELTSIDEDGYEHWRLVPVGA